MSPDVLAPDVDAVPLASPEASALEIAVSGGTTVRRGDRWDAFEIARQVAIGPDGVRYRVIRKADGARFDLLHLSRLRLNPDAKEDWAVRLRLLSMAAGDAHLEVEGFDLEGLSPFVVLEPLPSATLRDRLEESDAAARLDWAAQLADAVASAHRIGAMHGRLTSSTVYVEDDGRLRLDLLASNTFDEKAFKRPLSEPRWPADDAEDVRSLGCILKELLDSDALQLLAGYRTPRHAAEVRIAIARCESTDHDERPSATAVADMLNGLRTTPPRHPQNASVEEADTKEIAPKASEPQLEEATPLDPDATFVGGEPTGDSMPASVAPTATRDSDVLREEGLVPGATLGRFRIVRKIGQGGMGSVFEAHDVANDRRVAIKTLRGSAVGLKQTLQRFRKEARLLASVRNPHVANLLEANEERGLHYLAMEFVEGPTLKQALEKFGALDEALALRIARNVARGLLDAHRQGIVHRDVKPENVLLERVGDDAKGDAFAFPDGSSYRVKLSDFGIARHIDQSESLAMTQAGALLGTPRYMSPEQCRGAGAVTPQTDVYSLGVTLFEMIAGRAPFDAEDAMRLAAMHCFEEAPALSRIARNVSSATEALVAKALAKASDARFADASHFLREASRALSGENPVSAERTNLPKAAASSLFQVDFAWDLEADPAELWPLVSDTDRFNRAAGLPLPKYRTFHDESGMRRTGSMRLAGVSIEWEERPFEWVEGRRFGVLREFSKGPFVWFANVVELERLPTGGTRVHHRLRLLPRGLLGKLVAKVEIDWKARRTLEKVYRSIDRTLIAGRSASISNDPFEKGRELSASRKKRLQDRVAAALGRGADPQAIGKLASHLEQTPELAAAKLRPLEFAKTRKLDEQRTVEAFLYAASEGLLSLRWDILCPTCRVASETVDSLRELRDHAYCEACDLEFASDAAEAIELVFQVHPEIRKASTAKYCVGGPYHAPHVVAQLRLEPGETVELETALGDGRYVLRGPNLSQSISVIVRQTGATYLGEVALGPGRSAEQELALRSGQQVFSLHNAWDRTQLVRLERTAGRQDALTAARATAIPVFRRLFAAESFSAGVSVESRRATFLATRLVDIDCLYRTLGDSKAFTIVNRHVEIVAKAAEHRGGVCTRTTGEGVFAIFDDALDATKCALELHDLFRRDEALVDATFSIGVHAGPAVVTSIDGRTDYFGLASRIAARLADEAGGGAALSDAIFPDPSVDSWLRNQKRPFDVTKCEIPGGMTIIARLYQSNAQDDLPVNEDRSDLANPFAVGSRTR